MYIHKTVIKCYIPIHRTVSVIMADQIALEAELPFPSTPSAALEGWRSVVRVVAGSRCQSERATSRTFNFGCVPVFCFHLDCVTV